jgi:hypothetical protein
MPHNPSAMVEAVEAAIAVEHSNEARARAAIEASHHAELTEQLQSAEKRIRDLEGDCDSYRKTLDAMDEQANVNAPKLAHHAELVEALTAIRDGHLIGSPLHKSAWETMARSQRQIAREALAKIGGEA